MNSGNNLMKNHKSLKNYMPYFIERYIVLSLKVRSGFECFPISCTVR